MGTPMARDLLVVHADWGSEPRKRWMCLARSGSEGRFRVEVPEPVGELEDFWSRLLARAGGGKVLVGFDFPIGLPAAYARRAGIEDFLDVLGRFGTGEWDRFYHPAGVPSKIAVHRPFYPLRPGGTRQGDLLRGLGLPDVKDLYRRCERPTPNRGAASPLFWILGGKQVGRSSIIGWRDLLGPAIRARTPDEGAAGSRGGSGAAAGAGSGISPDVSARASVRIWPFDGELDVLLGVGRGRERGGGGGREGSPVTDSAIVVAETYPAEACVHLGIPPPGRGWSKRSQVDRAGWMNLLAGWSVRWGAGFSPALHAALEDGFGSGASGEDPFDALLGALSMIEVVLGLRPAGPPADDEVLRVEGWILGQG